LGLSDVSSASLVPKPPAKITAFIVNVSLSWMLQTSQSRNVLQLSQR
jgi:hypothetical protein